MTTTSGGKAREGECSCPYLNKEMVRLSDYIALEQELAEAKALLNQSIGMTNVTLLEKLAIAIQYLERIKIQNLDGLPDCPRIAAEGLEKIK
jgi:hypothetical protein